MSLNTEKKRSLLLGGARAADRRAAEARPGEAQQQRRVAGRELLGGDDGGDHRPAALLLLLGGLGGLFARRAEALHAPRARGATHGRGHLREAQQELLRDAVRAIPAEALRPDHVARERADRAPQLFLSLGERKLDGHLGSLR
jgi:hypothetical protein